MYISGSGHIAAGEYNEKISVSGSGRIDGNIRCVSLTCSGSVRGNGSVTCTEDVRVSGSCHIDNNIVAKSVSASGSVNAGGDIISESDVRISGSIHCGGSLKCANLRCSGGVNIGKGAEAEEIQISGRIRCDGLLNAERIDISLEGGNTYSRIGSVGGSEIKIHNDRNRGKISRMPLLSKLFDATNGTLTVDELVEGDIVAVECVKTPKVVGRIVAIGADCDIDLVQYSEEIEINPDSKVGRYEKI